MNRWLRRSMFSFAIFLALAVSAVRTAPAFADDSTPPPTETPTVVTPPVDEVTEAAPSMAESAPTEVAPAVDEPAPTEVPIVEETTPVQDSVADALAQVPEGTDVVVVNSEGETLSLASQEAADVISTGDPQWCPVGVTPGSATCSFAYTSLYDLISNFMSGTALKADNATPLTPSGSGVIWIQNISFGPDGAMVLDGADSDLASMVNFALTLKGGWTGVGTTINTGTPSTLLDSLSILNWGGDLTLSDIIITGVVSGSALDISTSKKVTLTNVNVTSNPGAAGAHINNTAGTSDVLVTNSQFSNNTGGHGLEVDSKGAITLTGVMADGNGADNTHDGLNLDNSTATIAKSVTLTSGVYDFSNNLGDGLSILSKGIVLLKDITAIGNGTSGAIIDNTTGTAVGVTLSGANFFSNTTNGSGLVIQTKGAIMASNLAANNNSDWGAILNNSTAATPLAVTLTGTNQFKFNTSSMTGNGLTIFSRGAITVSNLNASFNSGGGGVLIENTYSGHLSPQNVTITGSATTINNNWFDGIDVYTYGMIAISNLSASDNGQSGTSGYGAFLDNYNGYGGGDGFSTSSKSVTLSVSGVNTDTALNNNYLDNLVVYSLGAITLSGVGANGSLSSYGGYIENDFPGAVGGVTLNGWGGSFGGNYSDGLIILTKGVITAAGLWAFNNGGDGANLDNTQGTNMAVTIGAVRGAGFGNNDSNGLVVNSKGAITLTNIYAGGNSFSGAVLYNSTSTSSAGITITNTLNHNADFSSNGQDGLDILSAGNVILMDVSASNNGQNNFTNADNGDPMDNGSGFGITIVNSAGTGNVTIGTARKGWCNDQSNNFQSGLTIYSKGSVTLSNMCNDGNGGYFNITGFDPINQDGYGAYIENSSATAPKTVTLKGNNEFNNNYDSGLWIYSKGAITLNNLNANNNWGTVIAASGAILDNSASGNLVPQNVTLTGFGTFNNNDDAGLFVLTYGMITLNNIDAEGNGADGANLDNGCLYDGFICTATLAKSVTLNGNNSFNDNSWNGLIVASKGAIKVNNLGANDNVFNGAILNNAYASMPQPLTLTGSAYTGGNGSDGLQAASKGAILVTVSDIWAGNNGGYGWHLDNSGFGSVGGVTLSSPNTSWAFDFDSNGNGGLLIQSRGNILVTGLDSYNNTGDGATLVNDFIGATGTITLTAGATDFNNFDNNTGNGLVVQSNRAITLSNLSVNSNGLDGTYIVNASSPSSPQNVTLNAFGNFNNNGDTGLTILSYGIITVNNIDAENNGQNNYYNVDNSLPVDPDNGWGVYIDNCGYVATSCSSAITPRAVMINGINNVFNGNFMDGLWVTSLGAISGHALTANWNGGDGAYLDNQWNMAMSGITLTAVTSGDWNVFGNNGGAGLDVYSNRAITLNNIMSNDNGGPGTFVDTADHFGAYASQNVTFTGRTSFNGNGVGGLIVFADGNITINNLTANNNTGDGADLDNCLYYSPLSVCLGHGNVTISGTNSASFNTGANVGGLYVDAAANFTISNITADGNTHNGLESYAVGNTTISCASVVDNGFYDWKVSTELTVTLKGIVTSTGITTSLPYLANGYLENVFNTALISRTCP